MVGFVEGRGASAMMRVALLLAMIASAIAMYFMTPSTATASEPICHVNLAPYGQNGDRCWGPGRPLFNVYMQTYQRAGCVNAANSSNQLLGIWQCVGANSGYLINFQNDGIRRKGVIRNNNVSYVGYFAGSQTCYWEC
jgi:hypothetical protein